MSLPQFYVSQLSGRSITLDEDTSKHMTGVLRMTRGEAVLLTDGKGARAHAIITDDNRKRTTVDIQELKQVPPLRPQITLAVSLVKNNARYEWFLEKATEIGVSEIIPLLCERTEKDKFRHDRMQGILVSAMLQSQQSWMPRLHQPTPLATLLQEANYQQRFIAHCNEVHRLPLSGVLFPGTTRIILIGPEGDFTHTEIELATNSGFVPVMLGETRLRTETAGMVAATLMRLSQ